MTEGITGNSVMSVSMLLDREDNTKSVVYHMESGEHILFEAPFNDETAYIDPEVLSNVEQNVEDFNSMDDLGFKASLESCNARTIWYNTTRFN